MALAAAGLVPWMGGGLGGMFDPFEDDAFSGWDLDPMQLQRYLNQLCWSRGFGTGYVNGQYDLASMQQQMQQQMLIYQLLLGGRRSRRRRLRRATRTMDVQNMLMAAGAGGGFGGGGLGGLLGGGMGLGGLGAIGGGGGHGALMAPGLASQHMLINQPHLWYPM